MTLSKQLACLNGEDIDFPAHAVGELAVRRDVSPTATGDYADTDFLCKSPSLQTVKYMI